MNINIILKLSLVDSQFMKCLLCLEPVQGMGESVNGFTEV